MLEEPIISKKWRLLLCSHHIAPPVWIRPESTPTYDFLPHAEGSKQRLTGFWIQGEGWMLLWWRASKHYRRHPQEWDPPATRVLRRVFLPGSSPSHSTEITQAREEHSEDIRRALEKMFSTAWHGKYGLGSWPTTTS